MVGIPNPLAMFHHHQAAKPGTPSSSKVRKQSFTGDNDNDDDDDEDGPQLMPEVASKFSSSCEIFNVFKVLAAGKRNNQSLAEEVDSDESEADEERGESSEDHSRDSSLRHVGSTTTVRPDDPHGSEGGGTDKEETLRRWQSSFGSSTAEIDAQGHRLAGTSS